MTKKAPQRRPALRPQLEAFVRHYDANGGNATQAWLDSHPGCSGREVAAQSGYLALRTPEVRARVHALAAARYVRLQMTGDEALARVALDARADVRELFNQKGELLPIQEWPADVAQSVKSIRQGKDGPVITMNDSLAARRIILEQTGKLKGVGTAVGELARLLAGDDGDTTDV